MARISAQCEACLLDRFLRGGSSMPLDASTLPVPRLYRIDYRQVGTEGVSWYGRRLQSMAGEDFNLTTECEPLHNGAATSNEEEIMKVNKSQAIRDAHTVNPEAKARDIIAT